VKLYTFQNNAVKALVRDIDKNGRGLIVSPTGSGKTHMIAELCRLHLNDEPKRRILIVHPTIVLAQQNKRKIQELLPNITTSGLHRGASYGRGAAPASSQIALSTIASALIHLTYLGDFSMVIIDEAHHGVASQYIKLLGLMGRVDVAGFTATPIRDDGVGLSAVFGQTPSHIVSVQQLIKSGNIVPPRVLTLDDESVKEVLQAASVDYDSEDVATKVRLAVPDHEVARKFMLHAGGGKGHLFSLRLSSMQKE
jgi:DNA repair protein RadD